MTHGSRAGPAAPRSARRCAVSASVTRSVPRARPHGAQAPRSPHRGRFWRPHLPEWAAFMRGHQRRTRCRGPTGSAAGSSFGSARLVSACSVRRWGRMTLSLCVQNQAVARRICWTESGCGGLLQPSLPRSWTEARTSTPTTTASRLPSITRRAVALTPKWLLCSSTGAPTSTPATTGGDPLCITRCAVTPIQKSLLYSSTAAPTSTPATTVEDPLCITRRAVTSSRWLPYSSTGVPRLMLGTIGGGRRSFARTGIQTPREGCSPCSLTEAPTSMPGTTVG